MKKKILLPLMMLCVGSFALATAVGCDNNKSSAMETLIGKDSITLEVNQEYMLSLDYDGKGAPTWKAEDPTIVSVVNGKLVGLNEGTTTVTVKVGSYTDTVTVTVTALDASKLTLEASEPNVTLYKGEEKQIVATMKYNGVAFDVAAEKSYESMAPDIVSVDNSGKMTAKAYGNATITVTYMVNGTLVATSVNVSVTSGGKVEIEQTFVGLVYGGDPVALTAKAYEKGTEKAGATITWTATEGQDVIELNGGTITAKNAGETEVTATYVDSEGKTQTDTVTVAVSPKEVDGENPLTLYKNRLAKDGYAVDLATLVNDNENDLLSCYVVSADGLTTEISYEGGKLDLSSLSGGEKELYLQTRNITYKVELELWTALIETVAELKMLQTTTNGWYLLGEDIDLTGTTWKYEESAEFSGVFDGAGHAIKGLTTVNSGLFSVLSETATVKDVTLYAKVTEGGALCASVAKGSNVTIEDISLYADVWETVNGGLIGMLAGQTTLTNVEGVVSQAMKTETNGALFATATVVPTLENVHIYSSLKLCGNSEDNNTKGEELNEKTGIVIAPAFFAEEVTILTIEEAGRNGLPIEFNGNSYVGYTIYANEIRTVDGTNGTAVVENADVIGRFGGYVDVMFEKADGTIDYCALPISPTYYLTNKNIATYLKSDTATVLSGKYFLNEDITLSGTWTSQAIFNGELDGQGHTISGMVLTSGGLFSSITDGATIKNVSVIGVQLQATSTGVFASDTAENSTITFENVYVSVSSSNTPFGKDYATAPNAVVLNNHQYKSGLISNANYDGVNITVKDCVIYMPEFMSEAHGFVAGYGHPTLTIKGSTFIGGNGKVVGTHVKYPNYAPTYTEGGNDYVICDAVDAYKALYGSAICDENNVITKAIPAGTTPVNANGWTDMQISAFEASHPLKVWAAKDFTTTNVGKLAGTSADIIVLTEDVDVKNTKFNVGTISGALDGQGHAITNIAAKAKNSSGLFAYLAGSIKNIAFKGALGNYGSGLVVNSVQANAYLENVYCEVTFSTAESVGDTNGYGQGGIFRVINNVQTSLSMKDVVVYVTNTNTMPKDSGAILGYGNNLTKNAMGIYMNNCYYIAPKAQEMGNRGTTTNYIGNSTGNGKDQYFFWDIGETVGEVEMTADDGLIGYVDTKDEESGTTTTGKAKFDAAVTAGTVTLTNELKALIYPTND